MHCSATACENAVWWSKLKKSFPVVIQIFFGIGLSGDDALNLVGQRVRIVAGSKRIFNYRKEVSAQFLRHVIAEA
jgi:hypothetical protein